MRIARDQISFWLLSITIVLALTLPWWVREGMFIDGILYAGVAHHLARGIGTFWFPVANHSEFYGHCTFHEQPPLGFGIQACFYRIVGDAWWTEQLYTAVVTIITIILMVGLWRRIFRALPSIKVIAWLPVLIWICIPVCFWSYRGDMCENTMGIFTLSAVWSLYHAMDSPKPNRLLYLLGGAMVFAASMVKGLPGLYPLAVPICYNIVLKRHRWSEVVFATMILLLTVGMCYGLIWMIPDARHSLSIYLFERLLKRVTADPTVGNHFEIAGYLLQELTIPILLSICAWVASKKIKGMSIDKSLISVSFLFCLIGLAGSLPLMLTRVQKAFYFVAALPPFAIAVAILLTPIAQAIVEFVHIHVLCRRVFMCVVLVWLVGICFISYRIAGTASRDEAMLHDVHIISAEIPRGSTISIHSTLLQQHSLICYLSRYDDLSYEWDYNTHPYYLGEHGSPAPVGYTKIDWGLNTLDVYRLNTPPAPAP